MTYDGGQPQVSRAHQLLLLSAAVSIWTCVAMAIMHCSALSLRVVIGSKYSIGWFRSSFSFAQNEVFYLNGALAEVDTLAEEILSELMQAIINQRRFW